MSKSFRQLYEEHEGKVSDKWNLYLDEWDRLFLPFREMHIQLLEIGVQNGGSLEIWGECFPNAVKIVGCDIDPKCEQLRFTDQRIALIIGDANTDECENRIAVGAAEFDIIIDDGSHQSRDIVRSFGRYFPRVKDGGIYVIEDMHSSYWEDFGGGLSCPLSSVEFFKRLADIVNFEHWRNNKSRMSLLKKYSGEYEIEFDELSLARIHSIEFINSLCIIKKMSPANNVLGKRFVVGTDESVAPGWKNFNGIIIQDLATNVKDCSDYDVFNLISKTTTLDATRQELTHQVETKETEITSCDQQIAEKERSILALSEETMKNKQLLLVYARRIMNAEQSIRQLTSQIVSRDQVEHTYQQQAQELAEIKSSHAWRLIKLIWRVRSFLRGQ